MPFINVFKSGVKVLEVAKTTEVKLPKSLQVEYKPNFSTFDNWLRNNRDHQADAYDIVRKHVIGQVSLPTGTGKTRVQIALHVSKMIEMSKANQTGIFVIGAHRLALCSQLLSELITVAVNAGIPFDIVFIGSHRFSEDKVHCKFKNKGFNSYVNEATSTTQGDEVRLAVEKAQGRKRHVICVSTYHSFDKLNVLDTITQCTYDEAHTLVGDDFLHNIILVKPKINFNFFFTATRRVQGEHGGMNNEEVFGKVLVEESPRKMIQKGEIIPPKLHIIQTDNEGDYDNQTMLVNTVMTGFTQHKYYVTHPYDNKAIEVNLGTKLLITTTGNLEMFQLHNNEAFKEFCKDIKVFAFSSQEGVFYNFESIGRSDALEKMNALADDEDAILMHIDILTEGIDLPSITGVMPFRELNIIKLLQTIGRGSRLLLEDRLGLYGGSIAPMDWDSYKKPCVWVILPELFRSLGDARVMKDTITNIVNTYEVPQEEYNAIDRYIAVEDPSLSRIPDRDVSNRRDRETGLLHTVETIFDDRFHVFAEIKEIAKKVGGFSNIASAVKDIFG